SKMKILPYFLVGIYATTTTALGASSPNTDLDAEAECGALGVMEFDPASLPEGVTAADVRKCRDHPMGRPSSPGAGGGGGGGGLFRHFLPTWVF
ncbi:hypothetical protein BO78DRAFT_307067, partial [Aspergillus sclerotiicarbonarius CBS 121057]